MGIHRVNAMANAVIWLSAGIQIPEGADLRVAVLAYATEMRKPLEKLRDPMFVRDMAMDLAKIQSQVAWGKNGQDIGSAKEGCLIANVSRK